MLHLQNLLNEARGVIPRPVSDNIDPAFRNQDSSPTHPHHSQQSHLGQIVLITPQHGGQIQEEQFSVDDAENPLQLLARASDLSGPPNQASYTSNVRSSRSLARLSTVRRDQDLQNFFGPFRPSLDVRPDIDPIEMGLVTEEEMTALFTL